MPSCRSWQHAKGAVCRYSVAINGPHTCPSSVGMDSYDIILIACYNRWTEICADTARVMWQFVVYCCSVVHDFVSHKSLTYLLLLPHLLMWLMVMCSWRELLTSTVTKVALVISVMPVAESLKLVYAFFLIIFGMKCKVQLCKASCMQTNISEPVPKPGNREDWHKNTSECMAGLTLALVYVAAAAALLVVIQWEAWVRGDHQLTKGLIRATELGKYNGSVGSCSRVLNISFSCFSPILFIIWSLK